MSTSNISFRVAKADWRAFAETCKSAGLKHSDVLRARITSLLANESEMPLLEEREDGRLILDDSVMQGLVVDSDLKAAFEVYAAVKGVKEVEIIRAWLKTVLSEEEKAKGQLPDPASSRREIVVEEVLVTKGPEPVFVAANLPLLGFEGYAPVPSFLLTNLSPPNSRHAEIQQMPIIGLSEKSGLSYKFSGELLGQSEVTIFCMLFDLMSSRPIDRSNRMKGLRANDLLDALGYSKERGRSAYVWLKQCIYRMNDTKLLISDANGFRKYDAQMLIVSDYTDDIPEGASYSRFTEFFIEGEQVMREKTLGRLDRFNVEIPVTLIELMTNRDHHVYVPIESRRHGYSEMALKMSSYLCGKWPVLENPEGLGVTYEYLRQVFGRAEMRMDKFQKAIHDALDELKKAAIPQFAGISRWESVSFKKGKGVRIYRERQAVLLEGAA